MSQVQTIPAALPVPSRLPVSISAEAVSAPWIIWFVVTGIAFRLAGGIWDLAWHSSIGLDTVWTPPHMLMQVSTILVGVACAYVILATTCAGASPARDAAVRVLGLHAPGGIFIAAWGCVAALASVPFDNWWHQAYGDAIIATPPHVLLTLGYFAIKIGAMAWIASIMNRSVETRRGRLTWLFLLVGSIGVIQLARSIPGPASMHSAACYKAFALSIPFWLIGCGWGSAHKWGSTIIAALYTGILLGVEWLLPLFPAQPKFGPVYHNVAHLMPLGFPLLLIAPSLVADLLLQRLDQRSSWIKAVCVGPALVLSFLAAQWPFASFLIAPASRNWIFGTAYFSYSDPAGLLYDPYKFEVPEKTIGAFLLTMVVALMASILATRLGLSWGNWMRRVRR